MMNILIISWLILGVVLIGLYNAYLLKDDKTPESDQINADLEKKWHFIGAGLFMYIGLTFWYVGSVFYIPLALSLFWLLFGGIVHKIGLNKPFFFVGTTAKTDKILRRLFKKNPERGSAILKISVFVLSLFLVLFFS